MSIIPTLASISCVCGLAAAFPKAPSPPHEYRDMNTSYLSACRVLGQRDAQTVAANVRAQTAPF